MDEIRLQHLLPSGPGDGGVLQIEVKKSEWLGKKAKLVVKAQGKVDKKGGIDVQEEILTREIELVEFESLPLPERLTRWYRFQGKELSIELYAEIEVPDTGLLGGSTKVRLDLGPKRQADEQAEKLSQPSDSFNLFKNFKAIPADAKAKVMGLSVVGLVVILFGLLVGWHDQTVPESQTFFFDHKGSKGKSESPLVKGLLTSGGAGLAVFIAIAYQLGRYIKIETKSIGSLNRRQRVPIAEIIHGRTHSALTGATLRVVAYNIEKGACRVKKKKGGYREELFSNTIKATCLYDQPLPHIPAHTEISPFLQGEVDFGKAYLDLLPPVVLDSKTGIDVEWEIQLLHDDFIDHELKGDPKIFNRNAFISVPWVSFTLP